MNIRMSDAPDRLAPQTGNNVLFAFSGQQGRVVGRGVRPASALPAGTAATLAVRLERAFAGTGPQGLVGGALAFDRSQPDCLWHCPATPTPVGAATLAPQPAHAPQGLSVSAQPEPATYARAVARALQIMRDEAGQPGALEKIVLARSLLVRAEAPIRVEDLLARLGDDPAVTAFRVALPARGTQQRWLCGATPELLLAKTGARITSHPLAGSARRRADALADQQSAAALMASDKDHREHALVVESILDVLSPWCRQLGAPEGTRLTSTRSMWHLGTRIEGELKDPETSSAVLAAHLHPTPAVCGVPMARANALIAELEPFARDFYAGAVGWCDARGDGAWHVAIRCAEICGAEARLYAGAGIVPGSDPMAEAAETGAKFGAFLTALGLPADAGLAGVTRDEVR
ncbi:isochorismate synthase [Paracoccus limosus]|uniref:isochorismate synthase n=2 Tax=Paracoccus limosus TaxID=913252 RepID=A0A844GZB4_9RHOB|nr:isochorismate synthase [Paracoccus limosus]